MIESPKGTLQHIVKNLGVDVVTTFADTGMAILAGNFGREFIDSGWMQRPTIAAAVALLGFKARRELSQPVRKPCTSLAKMALLIGNTAFYEYQIRSLPSESQPMAFIALGLANVFILSLSNGIDNSIQRK